ncbi:hypothetical protein PLESTB_000324300 [Pleodorina starrii]|uniref:Uncharacterized protein n=1 Tax=Pleodorina starrii TaxID=330485 RepID=A0A9W6BD24_9CHLO|nr:hypothetical protein PLESTB_000324300 [Pleodorina starrii]
MLRQQQQQQQGGGGGGGPEVTQLALGAFRAKLDRPATDYEAAPELFEFLEALFVELLAQIDLLLGPGRMLATCVSSLLLSTLHSRLHLTADQLAQKVVGIVGADGAGVTMDAAVVRPQ